MQLAIGDLADPGRRGATRCAAWTRSSTWPAARATSRARRSRSSTGSPPGGCCAPPSASARATSCGSTPLGATPHHPMRMQRAKALAAAARSPSRRSRPPRSRTRSIYAPGDRHLRWLERLGYLPAVPLVGRGIARTQPLWAEDAADCVIAALDAPPDGHARYELAGPETLTQREVVRLVLAAAGRRRRALPLPLAGLRAALRAEEALAGPTSLRHVGRGADARGGDAQRRAGRPTPRRSASTPRRMRRRARPSASDGRWCAHGCAASICARPAAACPR